MNVDRALKSLDCDPLPVFEKAGLQCSGLMDPELKIDFRAGASLLRHALEASGCEHFGLLLSQWFEPSHLGLVGRLSETAPTVMAALEDLVTHLELHDEGGLVTLSVEQDTVALGYALIAEDLEVVAPIYDMSAANMCIILRELCGRRWQPTEVQICRRTPSDKRPYKSVFQCPVHFDCLETQIVFPRHWLDRPPQRANREKHARLLEAAEREELAEIHGIFSARVRGVLRLGLPRGDFQAEFVAAMMNLHPRTLHRRLQAEGTSFSRILQGMRRAMSQQYLAATALPIREIASALGYGSNDAFDHAFRRWFEQSPRQWRQAHAAESKSNA